MGIVLKSEQCPPDVFELPTNIAIEANEGVQIKFAHPHSLSGLEAASRIGTDEAALRWPEVGVFRLYNGREIVVEPIPDYDERLLWLYLLGPVLSALLHQRGFHVLHASCIALLKDSTRPIGIGFLGDSGAGKSTTAAAFIEHGHGLLSDDLIAVPPLEEQTRSPMITPVSPFVKLWPKAMSPFSEAAKTGVELNDYEEKRGFNLTSQFQQQPVPLQALFVLEDGERIEVKELNPQAALMTLVNNSFCVRATGSEGAAQNLRQCAALLGTVKIYRLVRPRDFNTLGQVVQTVERLFTS